MSVAQGFTGEVHFDGTFVTLRPRRGLRALRARGNGERRFPVRSIAMVEYSRASAMKQGYIRFLTGGMQPLRGNPMRPAFLDAQSDPNAITFTSGQVAEFDRIRNEIDLAIGAV